jgi:hypothetical protein
MLQIKIPVCLYPSILASLHFWGQGPPVKGELRQVGGGLGGSTAWP